MNKQRPVNLDLTTVKFPIMAITSVSHRITGFLLFLCVPFLLWLLHHSLKSPVAFQTVIDLFHYWLFQLLIWIVVMITLFHLLAGVRHLMMDMGFAETAEAGRKSAITLWVVTVILIILTGVWIW